MVNVYVSEDDVDMVMMTTLEVIKNFAGLPSTSASPSNLNMLLTGPIIFAVLCLNFQDSQAMRLQLFIHYVDAF